MPFTNQVDKVIKLDKMILQSNTALKDNKPKRPLEPIIFQSFCMKTSLQYELPGIIQQKIWTIW